MHHFEFARRGLPLLVVLTTAQLALAGSPAIVSNIDGVVPLGSGAILSGFHTHEEGTTSDHPWYVIEAARGDTLDILLFANFPRTFFLYEVLDGNVEVGDSPFGANPDLLLLQEADFPGTLLPRVTGFEVSRRMQLLVQVDSFSDESGRYGLQVLRYLPPVPEPSTAALVATTLSMVWFFPRRRAV